VRAFIAVASLPAACDNLLKQRATVSVKDSSGAAVKAPAIWRRLHKRFSSLLSGLTDKRVRKPYRGRAAALQDITEWPRGHLRTQKLGTSPLRPH
jgi:hypothetical protein